jgi:hypothetical protein
LSNINPNPGTTVRTQVLDNELHIYASATAGEAPGSSVWIVSKNTAVTQTITQFAALIGADNTKHFVNVYNPGPATGHFKLTFTNIL